MKRVLAVAALLAVAPGALAQGMKGMDMKDMPMKQGETKTHKGTGVVKSVDPKKLGVTLEHGPIASLNWPAMTMGFVVKDKALLEKMKPGAKVEFEMVQQGSTYIITSVK
jgi:Cu(I)/Ag(I) efflux system protein CusF